MQHSYVEKVDYAGETLVQSLRITREGTLHRFRPDWLKERQKVPVAKSLMCRLLMLNPHRHLCYHDFW
jgi:hypothetical protein